jgi:hypothetical protein
MRLNMNRSRISRHGAFGAAKPFESARMLGGGNRQVDGGRLRAH